MKHLITLAAVGLCALMTTQVANAQGAKAEPKPAAAAPAKAAPAKAAMKSKWTAEQIKDVQTGLQKAKLYTGKINGVWTASTIKAYKAWQKANSMPEDGKLTEEAIAKLKGA